MPAKRKLTPMFEQYLSIKEEYPDALLFYRMGDFYELFFEDAEVAARELQIALTSRNPNQEMSAAMCGVPHHAVEGYLSQLLDKGYKVAICDQIEDPKQAKGLVKRAVTRVLTPGTAVEDGNLPPKSNNYLAALYWSESRAVGGLAWVDYSTGAWSGLQTRKKSELWQWTVKMAPRELLLPDELELPKDLGADFGRVNRVPQRAFFDLSSAGDKVLAAQSVADLGVVDLQDKPELTRACGALLTYLVQTQKHDPSHLAQFRPLSLSRHLLIDEVTERNLELFRTLDGRTGPGTLYHVLDTTLTPMGARLLAERLRHPWRDMRSIQAAQDVVAWLHDRDEVRDGLRLGLDEVYDLERLSTRISLGRAQPKDFIALRRSLEALPRLRLDLDLAAEGGETPQALVALLDNWDDCTDCRELLERSLVDSPPPQITEGGLFRVGYHPELDELIELSEHGEARIRDLAESERAEYGLPKLKVGHNRVFGYYFELPRGQAAQAPEHFERRQTLANCERYVTGPLKELEERVVSAFERRKTLELDLFQKLRAAVAEMRPRLLFMADTVAWLDYWQSLAQVARQWRWSRPLLHEGIEVSISQGRHPVVEAVQGAADFIPNDIDLGDSGRLLIITGPNMAGKSTVLRQTALIAVLAQMGSFVPAARAELGLADRVFTRVGASDNLAQGRSTFMVEMAETARILRQVGKRSLVILDEIGRGTSTFDGLALAWAVVEDLARRHGGVRTLFATHYHELTVLEDGLPGIRNFTIAVKEYGGEIVFLRKLVPGPSDRSYGIEVAKLAGVPRPVVQRAREVLAVLEKKAKSADRRLEAMHAAQTLLPGFTPLPVVQTQDTKHKDADPITETGPLEDHPLLEELAGLDIDQLTPMEALNVLNTWKETWGKDGHDPE